MITIDIFNENLRLTQQYCALQLLHSEKSDAEILRSINPEYDGKKLFSFEPLDLGHNIRTFFAAKWSSDPTENRVLMQEIFDLQLVFKKSSANTGGHEQIGGRILASEFENTVIDGISEAESNGFIDLYDLPPVDTWFYIHRDSEHVVLYSWIPEKFVGSAQAAIEVNCLDIIYWVDGYRDASIKLMHNY